PETRLVVVVMNDRLAAVTEFIFLLDHGRPVAGLALPDDGGAVTITVALAISMGFADGHASAYRAHANTDFLGQSGSRNRSDHGGSKDIFPHLVSSSWLCG